MKRKALRFGAMGFLFGCFVYLLFSIAVSLRMNTGDFYFALPALTSYFKNELYAVIAQIVTFVWFGTACGIAYMFIENVDLAPNKQGISYLVSLTVGMIPLAWTGQWIENIFIGLFSYIIIVTVVSLFIYAIVLVKLKNDVDEIRKAIGVGKEAHDEEN